MAPASALGRGLGALRQVASVAALFGWLLGLHRGVGLVLDLGRRRGRLGLGGFPLWPLVLRPQARLVLDSRRRMGPGLGELAGQQRLCRLGAAAARRLLRRLRQRGDLLDFRLSALSGRPRNTSLLRAARAARASLPHDGHHQSHAAARWCDPHRHQSWRRTGTHRARFRRRVADVHRAPARDRGYARHCQCGQRIARGVLASSAGRTATTATRTTAAIRPKPGGDRTRGGKHQARQSGCTSGFAARRARSSRPQCAARGARRGRQDTGSRRAGRRSSILATSAAGGRACFASRFTSSGRATAGRATRGAAAGCTARRTAGRLPSASDCSAAAATTRDQPRRSGRAAGPGRQPSAGRASGRRACGARGASSRPRSTTACATAIAARRA